MSPETGISVTAGQGTGPDPDTEARLLALVLDTVTSAHSRRSYRTSLVRFFTWTSTSASLPDARPHFSKALVGEYRSYLLEQGLSPASINLRLAPIRRLAREMAENSLLAPEIAAAIERVPGVTRRGTRLGNWLTKEQANDLLNAPDPRTLNGKRDRAILALLIGCGLRRAELLRLNVESLQLREAHWVIPDLEGKGNRVRTVTVPAGVKARIDLWTKAAAISEGRIFRPVTRAGVVKGSAILDEKVVWRLVVRYAKETELGKLAPHDLRRTCAKLCRMVPDPGSPGSHEALRPERTGHRRRLRQQRDGEYRVERNDSLSHSTDNVGGNSGGERQNDVDRYGFPRCRYRHSHFL